MTYTLEVGTGGSDFRASIGERAPAYDALCRFFSEYDRTKPRSRFARVIGKDVLTEASRPLFDEVVSRLSIAAALSVLDDDWLVFNAVPVASAGSVIDHLVIGPGGVFALTVADHSDHSVWVAHRAFRAAGSSHNHIRNVGLEVGCVERLLSAALGSEVTATGVIVVVDPSDVVVRGEPRDVAVVASRELVGWFESHPMSFTADQVDALAGAASSPLTWVGDSQVDSGAALHGRFNEVQRASHRASCARRLWIMSAVTLVITGFSLWAWALMMLEYV